MPKSKSRGGGQGLLAGDYRWDLKEANESQIRQEEEGGEGMSREVPGVRGTPSAKVLRQVRAWCPLRTVRSPVWLEQNGQGERNEEPHLGGDSCLRLCGFFRGLRLSLLHPTPVVSEQ